jgi:hypothetical protein
LPQIEISIRAKYRFQPRPSTPCPGEDAAYQAGKLMRLVVG